MSVTTSSLLVPRQRQSRSSWGLADALAALREAAPALGLPSSVAQDATVVQVVSTAVFAAEGLALKVHPPEFDTDRLCAVARVLRGASDTWVSPAAGPVQTVYGTVTAYPWLEDSPPVSWGELGALLRRWHATPVPLDDLPPWTPLARVPHQVALYSAAPGALRELAEMALRTRLLLLDRVAGLVSRLGIGAIHGDVSPSNAMRSNGFPLLIDSDFVARGPLEYDLVSAALRLRRGEIAVGDYEAFCAAYGHDVRDWCGLQLIEEICELGAVTFRMACDARRGDDLSWVREALARWS